jgi:hypothetical protein
MTEGWTDPGLFKCFFPIEMAHERADQERQHFQEANVYS